eukprot:9501001-Pyramimonas_sp.AAC.1
MNKEVSASPSFCPSSQAGGVVAFFPNFAFLGSEAPKTEARVLVPGRVLNLRIGFALDIWISHYNVHNFKLTREQKRHVAAKIREDIDQASAHPESCLAVVAGDFNFADQPPIEEDQTIGGWQRRGNTENMYSSTESQNRNRHSQDSNTESQNSII